MIVIIVATTKMILPETCQVLQRFTIYVRISFCSIFQFQRNSTLVSKYFRKLFLISCAADDYFSYIIRKLNYFKLGTMSRSKMN